MDIHLNDPTVQAAVISAIGSIATGVLGAVAAAIIGQRILELKRLAGKLELAQKDIVFLLEVEKLHCEAHVSHGKPNMKLTVRKLVREAGGEWSGKFTPGTWGRKKPSIFRY